MSYIGADELIFNRDIDNNVYSGGFSVESIMLKNGFSPISTLNNQFGGGTIIDNNQVSDLFHNLAVPNWLLTNYKHSLTQNGGFKRELEEEDSENNHIIDDDLHDRLLELVKADNSKNPHSNSKKLRNKQKNKNTKKNLKK